MVGPIENTFQDTLLLQVNLKYNEQRICRQTKMSRLKNDSFKETQFYSIYFIAENDDL